MALERSQQNAAKLATPPKPVRGEEELVAAPGFVIISNNEAPPSEALKPSEPESPVPPAPSSIRFTEPPMPKAPAISLDVSLDCSTGSQLGLSVEGESTEPAREGASCLPREGALLPTAMCQLCGESFWGYDYNAPWFGLAGCRHGRCQHCYRSVCAPCSSNTLPLKVANIQETVCDHCFEAP